MVPGVPISRIAARRSAGSVPASRASHARSGHVSRERALGRSRSATASWCRSIKISASFHHDSRRDKPSSDTARETVRKISFKPASRRSSHHPTGIARRPGTERSAALRQAFAQVAQVFGTHNYTTEPRGARQPRSEWAPVIASPPIAKAILTEVSGWARQILANTARLTSPHAQGQPGLTEEHRKLVTATRWLAAFVSAVDHAQRHEPVPGHDISQLHAIPANVLQPRRQPRQGETIAALCQGTADCAERIRRAAATAVHEAAWSPCLTAESFSQTAESAAVVAHNCEIITQALATRSAQQGNVSLSQNLFASAEAAADARLAWLAAARAWYSIRTDAQGGTGPVAVEAGDLALWTGRLAYANPAWVPNLVGPSDSTSPPQARAGDPSDIAQVASAVHQASLTLTAIAASDYAQICTAARNGRLVLPAVQANSPDHPERLFDRAPAYRSRALLHAYQTAGTASVTATAQISRTGVRASPDHRTATWLPGGLALRVDPHHGRDRSPELAAAAIAARRPDHQMPGPVERALRQLGVTDQPLIARAVTVDQAACQLLAEAAEHTAPQRWHAAVTSVGALADPAQVLNHVLAADDQRRAEASAYLSHIRTDDRVLMPQQDRQAER
jgi:hypothetical protein